MKTTLFPISAKDARPTFGIVDEQGEIDQTVARSAIPDGISSFFLFRHPTVAGEVATMNAIQSRVIEDIPLGIPVLFDCEGSHGPSLAGAMTFPQSIGLGNRRNWDLIGRVFGVIRKELRVAGFSVALAPVLDLAESVSEILESWYEGHETGNAIMGILFGDVNPSGRRPVTIARNAGQLRIFYNRNPRRVRATCSMTTRRYPLGFGLGYTDFGYGDPEFDRTEISRDGTVTLSVTIANTRARTRRSLRCTCIPRSAVSYTRFFDSSVSNTSNSRPARARS
ncbi:glycoside hydrolase family 3 C-terminal domain-containing protein [Nocardia noduli]|uniref:glycoside hydrolase family 3 C-terminal domain-containing protein n=1 Tax=Nocardia noduli TaxID=2815722 RepID=UPI001C229DCA|nr:glycoside hydrolase family 3 C-terminal domain-containing protein [Nocardia noduli]